MGYATALDIYIIICFFFSFAALTEFAVINFIDVYFKRLKKWEDDFPEQGIIIISTRTLGVDTFGLIILGLQTNSTIFIRRNAARLDQIPKVAMLNLWLKYSPTQVWRTEREMC